MQIRACHYRPMPVEFRIEEVKMDPYALSTNVAAAAVGLAARELEEGGVAGAGSGECAMVQEDAVAAGAAAAAGGALIAPRRLPNPCLDSPQRMDLHRELLFNQRIGKNVLNQKSELQKALSRHKEKQILNQEKEHKETPELERAIAERARRLELAEQGEVTAPDPATNPTYQEVRARLRHAAPHAADHH